MPRCILALDPGNIQSACVLIDTGTLKPLSAQILTNAEMLTLIESCTDKAATDFVIEMVASYGMAVGETVFETAFWIGQFYAAARQYNTRCRLTRMDVKMNLCHSSRARDCNIRQALIDRFGIVGTKKAPGWFYGFKADMWAAYAVGVTYYDIA